MTDEIEWITSREGAELLGIKQPNFLYYAKNGDIAFRQGKKAREYSRSDTLKVRKILTTKSKRTPPEEPLIDWLYAADVPAGLKLSMQVYPGEVDLAEAAIYQAWRRNNIHLTMAAFSQDRNECFASVQVVPIIEEQIIIDVLSGKREEMSIQPDEIPAYDRPGAYNLLVTSATCLPSRPHLLYEVLYKYMQFWIGEYPIRWPRKIYAQAVSESGMRIVQHFFMSPLLNLAPNAFVLDLAYPPVSRIIRRFKSQMEAKAPLPADLHWPPVTAATHAPIAVEPQAPIVPSTPIHTTTSPPAAQITAPSDLPPGTLHIQDFLAQHGLKRYRRRIVGYMDTAANNLHFHLYPKPNRSDETDRFLTPEQQETLLTWLHSKHPDIFTQS